MKHRLTFSIAACAIFVVGFGVRGYAQQATPQTTLDPASPAAGHQAVLSKYCYGCHNEKLRSGRLALTTLDISAPAKNNEQWEKVIRKLGTGSMPPAGVPRPDKAASDSMAQYLITELDRAALAHPNPGRPGLQRLNRVEYKNAIRDLLGLNIDAASMLPADTAGYGFDNNADALTLNPALTERYLSAAAKIAQIALERPRGMPTPETFFEPTDRSEAGRFSDEMPFGTRGGIAIHYVFPADGDYLIETRPKENGANDGFENFSTEVHQMDIAIDNVKILSAGLGGPEWTGRNRLGPDRVKREQAMLDKMKTVVHVKGGEHLVQAYFAAKTAAVPEDLFDPSVRREPYRPFGGVPKLQYLRITGPLTGTASVTTETESRRRVLICSGSSPSDEACAKRILSTLARRAFRHPVTDADLEAPMRRFRAGAKQGDFESGIEMGLRNILLSPKFSLPVGKRACERGAEHALQVERR